MDEETEHDLPGRITSINAQKKNKDRYSVFVDDQFLIGVAEQTLLDFNLSKGVEMTSALLRKIRRAEGRFKVKAYLLKLLGRRDHASKELFTKAKHKNYAEEVIDNVIDELQKKGFIDDTSFAEKFASEKSKASNWGPVKIKAHLLKRGISRPVAERGIQKAFEGKNLKETFLHLVLKRKKHFLREENPYKRKKKVFDHLSRKGFRSSDIYDHLEELMKAIEK